MKKKDQPMWMRLAPSKGITPAKPVEPRPAPYEEAALASPYIRKCISLKTPLIWVHILKNTSNMGAHH